MNIYQVHEYYKSFKLSLQFYNIIMHEEILLQIHLPEGGNHRGRLNNKQIASKCWGEHWRKLYAIKCFTSVDNSPQKAFLYNEIYKKFCVRLSKILLAWFTRTNC